MWPFFVLIINTMNYAFLFFSVYGVYFLFENMHSLYKSTHLENWMCGFPGVNRFEDDTPPKEEDR